MKQLVETDVCDRCHEERKSYECCDGCEKLFCSYCSYRDNSLIIYPHIRFVKHEDELLYAMNSSYLGDGKYCKSCDDRLALEGTDKLFLAFRMKYITLIGYFIAYVPTVKAVKEQISHRPVWGICGQT